MSRGLALAGLFLPVLLGGSAAPGWAGEADVIEVEVACEETICRFDVTVRHGDEGWDHYADRWEVLDPDGEVLAVRVLAHPHVHEQPFTRSLEGVEIPREIDTVTVRARDSVHGYGGTEVTVTLTETEEHESNAEGDG